MEACVDTQWYVVLGANRAVFISGSETQPVELDLNLTPRTVGLTLQVCAHEACVLCPVWHGWCLVVVDMQRELGRYVLPHAHPS